MSKTHIVVPVKISLREIRKVVRKAGCKIIDEAKFAAALKKDSVLKSLAQDLAIVWYDTNLDSDNFDVLTGMFTSRAQDGEAVHRMLGKAGIKYEDD